MSQINIIVGRMTKDVEIKENIGTNNITLAEGCIVWDNSRKNTEFRNFTMFGKMASAVGPYMKKGTQVQLVCEDDTQKWEKDGEPRQKIQLTVKNVTLLGSKNNTASEAKPSEEKIEQAPF